MQAFQQFTEAQLDAFDHASPSSFEEVKEKGWPFLYSRKWGYLRVIPAGHCFTAAILLAFDRGLNPSGWYEACGMLGSDNPQDVFQVFLKETKGVAFLSGAGSRRTVTAWRANYLNINEVQELSQFGKFDFLDEEYKRK